VQKQMSDTDTEAKVRQSILQSFKNLPTNFYYASIMCGRQGAESLELISRASQILHRFRLRWYLRPPFLIFITYCNVSFSSMQVCLLRPVKNLSLHIVTYKDRAFNCPLSVKRYAPGYFLKYRYFKTKVMHYA